MAAQSPSAAEQQAMLGHAIQSAQRGDLLGARKKAEDAIARIGPSGEAAQFHAFLGMVAARLGDLPGATGHLQSALATKPNDITIACNLIAILMDQQRDEEALAVASIDRAKADTSLRVARYRGFLSQNLERFPEAVEAYEIVLAQHKDDFECWNNLGNARSALEDYQGAVEALRTAVALDPTAAPARLNLVSALQALALADEAEAELIKACEDFPEDSRPPHQLYIHYKTVLRQPEAVAAIEEAARRDPNSAEIQLKLGIEYGVERRTEDAERAYRRTIELDPTEVDAYLGLAIQLEHTNREDEFAPLIALARQNSISEGPLAYIEALELRREKRFEEALAKLDEVPDGIEPIRVAHARATVLDRLSRTDEAFAAFTEANTLAQDNPTDPLGRAASLRERLSSEIEFLNPNWVASWKDVAIEDSRPDPVFLVGFPRSGTTLLDTILMGHPETVVMEEEPPLNRVEEKLGGISCLPEMSSAAIAEARDMYFAEVEMIQPLPPGKTLVDKSPLFLYRLPLIRRLFPNARVILALRHPCDVVLSCFMSNFRLNSAMANFLRLEDAASLYDLSFSHWSKAHELFPHGIHPVRYENLVEDVEREVRPLIDWLGLEWSAELLDHTTTARSRGLITTASYSQVVEPIYKRASGRWLRYRKHLEPVSGTLEHWINQFGYGSIANDPAAAEHGG